MNNSFDDKHTMCAEKECMHTEKCAQSTGGNTEKRLESDERRLELLEQKLTEAEKQVLYMRADMENVRRSALREIQMKSEKNAAAVILEFLTLCDDLQRCLDVLHDQKDTPLAQGLFLINKTMHRIFQQLKIEVIADGKIFDPELHEALSFVPVSGDNADNTIVSFVRPGYKYQGKVLRPAQVIVATE